MADVVTSEVRSRMMAGILGKNTKPEMVVRRRLHAMGLRYKLHDKSLPGKPDLVFPKYHAVVFVHGCFWHGHECDVFRWPKTRKEFWEEKITGNKTRDERIVDNLLSAKWRVATIWECSIRKNPHEAIERLSRFLVGQKSTIEL